MIDRDSLSMYGSTLIDESVAKVTDPNVPIDEVVRIILRHRSSRILYSFVEHNIAYDLICLEKPDWMDSVASRLSPDYHKFDWSPRMTRVYALWESTYMRDASTRGTLVSATLFWKFYVPCVVIPEIRAKCPDTKVSAEALLRVTPPSKKLKVVPKMILDGANPYEVVQKVLGKSLTNL